MSEQVLYYDVILSHGPGCKDGATAAWCVWRNLSKTYRNLLFKEGGFYSNNTQVDTDDSSELDPYIHPNSPNGAIKLQERGFPVVFVFIQPNEAVPLALVKNKRVLILDLDMGDKLVDVVTAASYVLLVDHHDSTPITIEKYSAILNGEFGYKFATYVNTSKSESGATLAWKLIEKTDIPPFVQIVRIGDTWQWDDYPKLNAHYVLMALNVRRTFRSFVDIENTFITWSKNFQGYVQKGRTLYDYEKSIVKRISKQCDLGFIQTNDGTVYNVAYVQCNVLHSEVGVAMKFYAEQRFKMHIHFCATWKYVSYNNIVSVSLRNGDPDIDLSTIARNVKYSNGAGGGHVEASAFAFHGLDNFHNFILKSNPLFKTINYGVIYATA